MHLSIEQINRIYNIGYNAGHNDTVEGCAIPAHNSEMDSYNREFVEELIEEIIGE